MPLALYSGFVHLELVLLQLSVQIFYKQLQFYNWAQQNSTEIHRCIMQPRQTRITCLIFPIVNHLEDVACAEEIYLQRLVIRG